MKRPKILVVGSLNMDLTASAKRVPNSGETVIGMKFQTAPGGKEFSRMAMPDFQKLLAGPEYDFLRNNEHLGKRVMILGLSGSYGYGTNREGSDVDFRGVALQRPSDILGLTEFEQYADTGTDTVVFGFNKFVRLLLECNPSCCEVLGLSPDKYMILSSPGKALLENSALFLSKRIPA